MARRDRRVRVSALARLASILRQKKSRRRRSGPREKKRSKGSVPSSPSSPSSLGRRRRRGSRVVHPGRRGFERASTRSYSPRRSPFRRARAKTRGRKRRREPARGKGFRLSVPSSSARARRVARVDDDAGRGSGSTVSGRRRRGGVRGTRGVPVVHIPIGSSLSSHRRESRFARARVVSLLACYIPRRRNPSARSRGPPPRARLPYPFTRR